MKNKVNKEHASLNIDSVRIIRGHSYSVLRRSIAKIPSTPGVYVWRYWPNIPSLNSQSLTEFLQELQRSFPQQVEVVRNSRVEVTVQRTPFGTEKEGRLLGIKSEKKIARILDLLDKDVSTRQTFAHTLEMLISSFPPIYIGKADNLQERLRDHFESKTDVLDRIDRAGIPKDDIYISFIQDGLADQVADITSSLEEILQRLTNPAYTKRYG